MQTTEPALRLEGVLLVTVQKDLQVSTVKYVSKERYNNLIVQILGIVRVQYVKPKRDSVTVFFFFLLFLITLD